MFTFSFYLSAVKAGGVQSTLEHCHWNVNLANLCYSVVMCLYTESPCALFPTGLGHGTGLSSELYIFDLSEIMCQYYFWSSKSLTTWTNHEAKEESCTHHHHQQTERGFRKNDQKNNGTQEEYWQWGGNHKHWVEEPSGRRASARQYLYWRFSVSALWYIVIGIAAQSCCFNENLAVPSKSQAMEIYLPSGARFE